MRHNKKYKYIGFKRKKRAHNHFYKLLFFLLLVFFIFYKLIQRKVINLFDKNTNIKNNNIFIDNKTLYNNTFEYFCCYRTMAKKENLYTRELISYYKKLGVEKFIFIDNNLPGVEKLSDVLQDYIDNGTVDIMEHLGEKIGHGEAFEIMYTKYNKRCRWLAFFDIDEYLFLNFTDEKNVTLNKYLTNPIFNECEGIAFNWLMYYDNNLVYYDNRTLVERFTKPNYNIFTNRFVKSIIRGNLNKRTFYKGGSPHLPDKNVKICNSIGEPAEYYPDSIVPPIFKYAYLKHFSCKSTEEFVDKIKKGAKYVDNAEEKVDGYFKRNEFTEEKLKVLEKLFGQRFDNYHKNK